MKGLFFFSSLLRSLFSFVAESQGQEMKVSNVCGLFKGGKKQPADQGEFPLLYSCREHCREAARDVDSYVFLLVCLPLKVSWLKMWPGKMGH